MQRGPAPGSSVKPAASAPAPFPAAQPTAPVASTSKAAATEQECVLPAVAQADTVSTGVRPTRRFVVEQSASSFPVLSLTHATSSHALGRRSFGSFNRDVEVRSLVARTRLTRSQKLAQVASATAAPPDEPDPPTSSRTTAAPTAAIAERSAKPRGFVKPGGSFPSERPATGAPKLKRPSESDADAATTARAEAKAEKKRRKLAKRAAAADGSS